MIPFQVVRNRDHMHMSWRHWLFSTTWSDSSFADTAEVDDGWPALWEDVHGEVEVQLLFGVCGG